MPILRFGMDASAQLPCGAIKEAKVDIGWIYVIGVMVVFVVATAAAYARGRRPNWLALAVGSVLWPLALIGKICTSISSGGRR